MSHFHHLKSIKFKLNLLNLRNLDAFNLPGEFFIRYYIVTGTGKRIRVDSQVLPSMSSLELKAGSNTITELLEKRSIIFELRWRKPKPMFKCFAKSKLLGKAEVSWKDIVRPDGAPMERWISFVIACQGVSLDVKPPALLVRIEASLSESIMEKSLRRSEIGKHEECGCRDCQWIGSEEDLFYAAATALDIV
ncbi:hypothetical protein J5N97_006761 [Dioscorea zingiberensis]|uniref:Uncharacterized protein n=1 Tax=Dioscorea zingiberensis TaxID=325984 RepID=A0A9D5DCP2_9LILI|nr:hypothetical protein J5N97_006761 [Dioscorea zingiberensis]